MENDKLVRMSDVVDELNEWYAMYPDSDTAREALALAKKSIRRLPAVDAVEARHGYWLKTLDGNVCSDCGSIERVCRRFCPQCGCDMRTGL